MQQIDNELLDELYNKFKNTTVDELKPLMINANDKSELSKIFDSKWFMIRTNELDDNIGIFIILDNFLKDVVRCKQIINMTNLGMSWVEDENRINTFEVSDIDRYLFSYLSDKSDKNDKAKVVKKNIPQDELNILNEFKNNGTTYNAPSNRAEFRKLYQTKKWCIINGVSSKSYGTEYVDVHSVLCKVVSDNGNLGKYNRLYKISQNGKLTKLDNSSYEYEMMYELADKYRFNDVLFPDTSVFVEDDDDEDDEDNEEEKNYYKMKCLEVSEELTKLSKLLNP